MKSARSFQQYRPAIRTLARLILVCVCSLRYGDSVWILSLQQWLCSSWLVLGVKKAKLASEEFDPVHNMYFVKYIFPRD